MKIIGHSGVYTLTAEQFLPIGRDRAWEFLSDPANLLKITPPEMRFEITSGEVERPAYPGQIITYRVSPIKGIRSNWVTEITQVQEGEFFIDEQRSGPYTIWHHEHRLKDAPGGVIMQDKITYKLPMGLVGRLVHPWLVRPQLIRIFTYRESRLQQLF